MSYVLLRAEGTNSYEYRYATSAMQGTAQRLTRRGAAAVILVADSIADIAFDGVAAIRSRGAYDVEGGMPRNAKVPRPCTALSRTSSSLVLVV